MLASSLVQTARLELDDVAKPYLWGDPELLAYAQEAVTQLVTLTGGIPESRNTDLCELTVTAGDPWVDLHPKIVTIKNARILVNGNRRPLIVSDKYSGTARTDYGIQNAYSDWDRTGEPHTMIIGMQSDAARVVPIPAFDTTIEIEVTRLPLADLAMDGDVPVKDQFQRVLLDYMKFRAYLKPDVETYDQKASDRSYGLFQSGIADALVTLGIAKRTKRVVRYGGL